MIFREATNADIAQIQKVRNAVNENKLTDPALITDNDVERYITCCGKGWVCEISDEVIGFAIADLKNNNIWALFVDPAFEGRGIGKILHDKMLNWYFSQNKNLAWLSTSPGTRAEKFYRKAGWVETGVNEKGEIKFEMTAMEWNATRKEIKQHH